MQANAAASPKAGSLELKLLANQDPLGRRRDDRSLEQTPASVASSDSDIVSAPSPGVSKDLAEPRR